MRTVSIFLTALSAVLLLSCNPTEPTYVPDPVGSYARGADCSWLTEQEQDGVLFTDTAGNVQECMRLMRDCGLNAIRLRVWVNHATGWCNKQDVLVKARRAHELKLRLMIDFHYSDNFSDPANQTTPEAWKNYTMDQLRQAVADHTTDILQALAAEGISPEWVQVGNETRNGMLWPSGKLWDDNGNDIEGGWARFASLQRAGYDAVKKVFPDTKVIAHIDNAYQNNDWFFRNLQNNGGAFDIMGLSHYPMMTEWSGKTWQEMNDLAIANMKLLYSEFQRPVMLVEIGTLGEPSMEAEARQVVAGLLPELKQLSWFAGTFYWEPQVFNGWRPKEYEPLGWGAYGMGAFTPAGSPNNAFLYLVHP